MLKTFFLLFFLAKLSIQDKLPPFSIMPTTTSTAQVVKLGDKVVLSCRATGKWALCSWMEPKGNSCDRLDENHFQTSCEKNPRIKYDIDSTEFKETDCNITLVDVNLSDDGEWKCIVKDDVHRGESQDTVKRLQVASPFKVQIDSPQIDQKRQFISLLNRTTQASFICSSKGLGSVKPNLSWFVDAEPAKSGATVDYSETYENGTTAVISELSLNTDYFGEDDTILSMTNKTHLDIKLECLSKQIDQKGNVIFQSFVSTFVTIEVREKEIKPALVMNPAGIAFATIVVFSVIIAIAFIWWARSKKRYCFEAENYRSRAVPGPAVEDGGNQTSVEVQRDEEEAVELLGSASFNRSSLTPRSILTNGSLPTGENLRSPPTEIVTFQTNGNDNQGVDPPPSAPVPEDSDASSLKEEVARSPELSVSFEPVGFSGVPPPTTQESAGGGLDTVDLTRNHLNEGENLYEDPSRFELAAVLRLTLKPSSSPPTELPPVPPQDEEELESGPPTAPPEEMASEGALPLPDEEQPDVRTAEIPRALELPPRSSPPPQALMPKPNSPRDPSDRAERLLELISDAPTSPLGPQHVSMWASAYSRPRLSESLITPRRQNLRQRNQYVTLSRPGSTHGMEPTAMSPLPDDTIDANNRPFSETSL